VAHGCSLETSPLAPLCLVLPTMNTIVTVLSSDGSHASEGNGSWAFPISPITSCLAGLLYFVSEHRTTATQAEVKGGLAMCQDKILPHEDVCTKEHLYETFQQQHCFKTLIW
jgi:hypothetical protein